jgi:branched-chain amino acid transport system ATP-binding protein
MLRPDMESSAPCLALESVCRDFGGLRAVDGVNLTVHPGERHALIGPNGAGKTTLFNLISGEFSVTAGTITWLGADVTRLPPHRRAALGIARTFQITRLFPTLTALENVLLACEALDRRRFTMHRPLASCVGLPEKAAALLEDFGLSDVRHELARNLAYGSQRRLEVALSMAGRPRLLLLDEPMAGLAPSEIDSMQAVLARLDPATAVLLIEHDMDMAFRFAERVTVLSEGRVVAEGHKDEISANRRVQDIYLGVPVE